MKFHKSLACALLLSAGLVAEQQPAAKPEKTHSNKPATNHFTGRIIGKKVRMRTAPDVESAIVRELSKKELVVVSGEKNDFYAVEAPTDVKAYIFRSFVLDNTVEGERVNIRLAPDREAPVIGHLSTGAKVNGALCKENNKWLEINIPATTKFFVAKEFIEYAGGPEFKLAYDKRNAEAKQLLESTALLSQAEMRKPFAEISIQRLQSNYEAVMNTYTDFPEYVDEAKSALAALQESYLQKKISHLESKASQLTKNVDKRESNETSVESEEIYSATDRMKAWEPVEQSLFLAWSAMHHAKSIDSFYEEQKLKSQTICGILEAFKEPVQNSPGELMVTANNIPVGYVYSTQVNLHELVGKQVTLRVSERPNNSFAFPAYYVLDVE